MLELLESSSQNIIKWCVLMRSIVFKIMGIIFWIVGSLFFGQLNISPLKMAQITHLHSSTSTPNKGHPSSRRHMPNWQQMANLFAEGFASRLVSTIQRAFSSPASFPISLGHTFCRRHEPSNQNLPLVQFFKILYSGANIEY